MSRFCLTLRQSCADDEVAQRVVELFDDVQYAIVRPPQPAPAGCVAINVSSGKASRVHMIFSQQADARGPRSTRGAWGVADNGSTNHTLVNGTILEPRVWTPLQVAKAWHAGRQLKLGGAAGAGVSQAVDGIAPSLATILAREPRPQPHPSNSAAAKQRPPRPGRVEPKLREPLGNGYMTVDPRSVKRLAPAPSPRDGLCSPFSAHTGQPLSARV